MIEPDKPNPYAPPQAERVPASPGVSDSGSLWRVVDGRLQVRHMASLPDVCISGGPPGEPGTRHSLSMRRIPEWIPGVLWLVTGILALPGWIPLGTVGLFVVAIANALPLAETQPRVLFFRSHSSLRTDRSRSWGWFVLFVVISAAVVLLGQRQSREFYEAGGRFNMMMLAAGAFLLFRSTRIRGYGRARKRADGWFELLGIPSSVIARLEELQQRQPPSMREP